MPASPDRAPFFHKLFRHMLLVLLASLAVTTSLAAEERELPLIDQSAITVSGISSGAAMAQQLHIAYADVFSGAGLIAVVPFGCSEGSLELALGRCIGKEEGALDVQPYHAAIMAAAAAGQVADPKLLAGDPVWVFHGALDTAVGKSVSDATVALYDLLPTGGVSAYVDNVEAAHLFPSIAEGAPCDRSISPWIGACDYDAAGEMLSTLYAGLDAPDTAQGPGAPALAVVDIPDAGDAGLAEEALLFVPESCPQSGCRMHMVLHGCMQSREQLGDVFAETSGYLPWAQANGIVLAFPQVKPQPRNPLGCWDWWGYASDSFQYRDGVQQKVLVNWLTTLTK